MGLIALFLIPSGYSQQLFTTSWGDICQSPSECVAIVVRGFDDFRGGGGRCVAGLTENPNPAGDYVWCDRWIRGADSAPGNTEDYTLILGTFTPTNQGYFPCLDNQCIPKNLGKQCGVGNPIVQGIGNKFQTESDYSAGVLHGLQFERFYNSKVTKKGSLGAHWRSTLDRRLYVVDESTAVVTAERPDGREYYFSGIANDLWVSDADSDMKLEEFINAGSGETDYWLLYTDSRAIEKYDRFGKLLSIQNDRGILLTFYYDIALVNGGDDDPATLDKVEDNFGNSLWFTYDTEGRISAMTDPEGDKYRYQYNTNDILNYVSYPDDTPTAAGSNPFGEDNPYREYHYEDVNFLQALTGITDEKGNRFATWTYDAQGRAISSQHANGVESVTLDYTHIGDATDPRVTVTNELGKDTTYHYTTLHGVRKVTLVEGHASANCAAANQNYTYDANGFLDEVTDWEGHVTDYDHDGRGLEIQRVEAKGTPQERTITTQWHTEYRLPTKITEPDRVIDFTYDTSGQLLERRETPITP